MIRKRMQDRYAVGDWTEPPDQQIGDKKEISENEASRIIQVTQINSDWINQIQLESRQAVYDCVRELSEFGTEQGKVLLKRRNRKPN
jgi:hypothetical protein